MAWSPQNRRQRRLFPHGGADAFFLLMAKAQADEALSIDNFWK